MKLKNVQIQFVSRRVSSGDAGAPIVPPLTAEEKKLGGRLEEFDLMTCDGDDGHTYQFTFEKETTTGRKQGALQSWFASGKITKNSPLLTAVDIPPPEEWTM